MVKKLKFRHEMKYYVNYHQYYLIRHRLKHFLKQDTHADHKGEYHIRSVYFDDIENKALQEKQAGIENRHKYRVRLYNRSDSVIHFEKKIKRNTFIAKERAAISRDTLERLIDNEFSVLNGTSSPLLKEVRHEMKNRLLRPKVIVDYIREAFVAKEGNARITFDKDLRTGLNKINPFDPDLLPVKALDEPVYIMEVKFDEYIPNYVRDALQLNGLQRQAASKYTICRKFTKSNAWEDQ
ncbi:polyphosphate polymerase domain-containing protein [Halobacillus sp. Marseille-P3879]|uniref:polyphosphate polymerase domain-containing protein n=1 Tax=Halobacillus sp. Marseille-P3879 TaxID=2045014 RepID=UPI000C79BC74|nr:polyphosphate polymerase domain-containing protein [Halobacillus sp. Marseille-P3879]